MKLMKTKRNKEKQEIKDLDKVEPIDYGVVAKPHTPVYKIHRYFARRPYTVFNELVRYYSNPGSIVLDPMCGGGVTIIEGLRLKRRVVGVDIDPVATFITKMESINIDINDFEQAFWKVTEKIKNEINGLYQTHCPKCGTESSADWFEWSNVLVCPTCHKDIIIAQAKKLRAGTYQCPSCKAPFVPSKAKRESPVLVLKEINCTICRKKIQGKPDDFDYRKAKQFDENLDTICTKQKLNYPKESIPPCNLERESALFAKGITHYHKMFTSRNLIACAILKKEISKIENPSIKELMALTFSSTLNWANKMCYRKKGRPVAWGRHDFWPPEVWVEINLKKSFLNRFKAALKGKQYSKNEIGTYCRIAESFKDLLSENSTCYIVTHSATDLSIIPDESVDCIVTDPPYGGNVNYAELSNFWAVWLKDELKLKKLIDNKKEAIADRHTDFKGAKSLKDYRDLLLDIFKECNRVLKPNRWMVMTFHNREFRVWNAIHLAAHDAGFTWSEKDGMIYQPPIQPYITAVYLKRTGSMLGDFILSYKKASKPPRDKWIEEVEIEVKIREIAKHAIEYHGGAKISTIYMRVMPFLLNNGLLEKIKESDLESYLKKDFVNKDERWYLKEFIDDKTGNLLDKTIEEYAPVKARLESIMRRFLAQGKMAKMDEILQIVYSRLINSNAAEYEEIAHVVNRICVKIKGEKGKELWQLKEERDRGLLFKTVKEKIDYKYSEESDHDIIIERLVQLGRQMEYESHIGLTEQKKDKKFRELSVPMGSNVQFGLNEIAFDRIREIDVLWIKNIAVISAFEVEKSTTIDSGITRFRELFAATPTLNISAYIVIPDKRENEAKKKIGSLANRRNGLSRKIKYILFSDLLHKTGIDLRKITREVT